MAQYSEREIDLMHTSINKEMRSMNKNLGEKMDLLLSHMDSHDKRINAMEQSNAGLTAKVTGVASVVGTIVAIALNTLFK